MVKYDGVIRYAGGHLSVVYFWKTKMFSLKIEKQNMPRIYKPKKKHTYEMRIISVKSETYGLNAIKSRDSGEVYQWYLSTKW